MMPGGRTVSAPGARNGRELGLLRHGETEGGEMFRGHTDDPLTPAGLAQMQAAVANDPHWQRVISSPLRRCAEFAQAFARRRALPLTFDARLKEIHFGQWEGRSAADLMADSPEALTRFWTDPDANPPPGGESLSRFQARVLEAWEEIVAADAAQRTLIVTHGGVIRVLLCHLSQRPVTAWHEFDAPLGSLRSLRIDQRGLVANRPAGLTP